MNDRDERSNCKQNKAKKKRKVFRDGKLSLCFGCCIYYYVAGMAKNLTNILTAKSSTFSLQQRQEIITILFPFHLAPSYTYCNNGKIAYSKIVPFHHFPSCWLIHRTRANERGRAHAFAQSYLQTGKSQTLLYSHDTCSKRPKCTFPLFSVTFFCIQHSIGRWK